MADQQEPSGFFHTITPAVVATLIVALISVSGVLITAVYNARAQRELEREQFESNLILKSIGNGDKKMSYENLRFLVAGGLIRSKSEKISALLKDTSFHFHAPSDEPQVKPSDISVSALRTYSYSMSAFSGVVLDDATGQPLGGVIVSMKTTRSRRRAAESQITGTDGLFTLHYPPRPFSLNYNLLGYADQSTQYDINTRFKGPLIVRLKGLRRYQY